MSRRRDYWNSLPESTKTALQEIRDLDAAHVRLSGAAPPAVLASLRAQRDRLIPRQEIPVNFAQFIEREIEDAGSQSALAEKLGVAQTRISSWKYGTLPSPDRMREIVTTLGYDWHRLRGDLLERDRVVPRVSVAKQSLTVSIPRHLHPVFGLDDDVPDRVRRLAWEAAAGAFQAVVRASH